MKSMNKGKKSSHSKTSGVKTKTPSTQKHSYKSTPKSTSGRSSSSQTPTTKKVPKSQPKTQKCFTSSSSSPKIQNPCCFTALEELYERTSEDNNAHYYSSAELLPRTNVFLDSTPTGDLASSLSTWTIQIGDYAAIQVPKRSKRDDIENYPPGGRECHPFPVSWNPCQILTIFREKTAAGDNVDSSTVYHTEDILGPLKLEVRWFYRRSALDERNKRYFEDCEKWKKARRKKLRKEVRLDTAHANDDTNGKDGNVEIFETVHVAVVDASALLGKMVVKLHQNDVVDTADWYYSVPIVVALCEKFYLHREKDILQLYYHVEQMITRGLECSEVLSNNARLRKATYKYLGMACPTRSDDDYAVKKQSWAELPPPCISGTIGDPNVAYYSSCTLSHPWSQIKHNDLLCPKEKRDEFPKWNLCVGDVVAIHCDDSPSVVGVDKLEGRDKWYPYEVKWSHAQIISIFRYVKDQDSAQTKCSPSHHEGSISLHMSRIYCHIRWFYRISDAIECSSTNQKRLERLKQIADDENRIAEEIFESGYVESDPKELTSLLGPVHIDGKANSDFRRLFHDDDIPNARFMPVNRRICNMSHKGVTRRNHLLDHNERTKRGVDMLVRLTPNERNRYLKAIMECRKERQKGLTQKVFDNSARAHVETKTLEKTLGQCIEARDPSNSSPQGKEYSAVSVGSAIKTKRLLRDRSQKENPQKKKLRSSAAPTRSVRKNAETIESTVAAAHEEIIENKECELTDSQRAHKSYTSQKRGRKAKKEHHNIECSEADDGVAATRVISCGAPFHVDVSSLKSFHSEIEVLPATDCYDESIHSLVLAENISGKSGSRKEIFNVNIGDVVVVEVDQQDAFQSAYFPFNVPWSPAEVVSIFRTYETKASCMEMREKLQSDHFKCSTWNDSEVWIEIRWFYRNHEIPGATKPSAQSKLTKNNLLEEVFETDQVGMCFADAILAPVTLHSTPNPAGKLPEIRFGMPYIHYYCSRFWSIHRKAFVPSGPLRNLAERGRMHSMYFGKNASMKSALKKLEQVAEVAPMKSTSSWRDAFYQAIQQLSLAEAAEAVQVDGSTLPCREREREKITSFLKNSIRGNQLKGLKQTEEGSNAKGATMFIAGGPGTGKSACVHAIIAELQEEQAKGNIPEFNFISLNGMEMRHPFHAYIKVWEALSGRMKQTLPAGKAAAEIEYYFTAEDADDYAIKRAPVTVLLLDEIDYIMTDRQTVLYNFFDWPMRCCSKARLVVIGISNTINLPERMLPRVQSRLGSCKCFFQSYNVEATQVILETRLGIKGNNEHSVFTRDAIKFAARKNANYSGDIRKGFQMCKFAAQSVIDEINSGKREIPLGDEWPQVHVKDMQKASREVFFSMKHAAVKSTTPYQALLVVALGSLKRSSGRENEAFTLEEVMVKMRSIGNASGDSTYLNANLSIAEVLEMSNRLKDLRILDMRLTRNSSTPFPRLRIELDPQEMLMCFRDTRYYKLAEKNLQNQSLFAVMTNNT
mmetsp:Transcript_6077/g.12064  ORF Transcript_6077/g.12064 Transcript_6077/m.12064 type:complete len:1495 (+) Transcript_6077:252-4736(+)